MRDRRFAILFLAIAVACASVRLRGQSAAAAAARTPHRWVDWQAASLDARYRVIRNSAGRTTTNQLQDRETVRFGVLFDRARHYSLQVLAGTGNSFSTSWDPLGPGTAPPAWAPHVRQFFLTAVPVQGLTLELGGFGFARGEQTEATSWDNDGSMTGVRATLRRPHDLYFDEIAITNGFVGDLTTPNVFRRFDRLDDRNYTQVLAGKHVHPRVSMSGDWTSFEGVTTLREAARVATKSWMPLDAVRLELYQRVEGTRGRGFAVSAERAVTSRLAVNGGYADIDGHFGTLNGDHFGIGRRLFAEARLALHPTFSVTAYYGNAVRTPLAIPNRRRFDVIASWNVLKAGQRAGLW